MEPPHEGPARDAQGRRGHAASGRWDAEYRFNLLQSLPVVGVEAARIKPHLSRVEQDLSGVIQCTVRHERAGEVEMLLGRAIKGGFP